MHDTDIAVRTLPLRREHGDILGATDETKQMRRVTTGLVLCSVLLGFVLLLSSARVPALRTARDVAAGPARRQPNAASKPHAPGRRADVILRLLVPALAEDVPVARLQDDPNRIPGPPLELRGTVLRGGEPAAGVAVRACRANPGEVPLVWTDNSDHWQETSAGPDPAAFAKTTTDGRGRFVLRIDRRSRVIVELIRAGAAQSRKLLYLPVAGDPPAVVFHLEQGHVVEGRVVGQSGRAVAGGLVKLVWPGGHRFAIMFRIRSVLSLDYAGTAAPGSRRTLTDTTGAFRFEDVPSGMVELSVNGERRLLVVPHETPLGFVVAEPARLRGTVRDTDGVPVAHMRFTLDVVALSGHSARVPVRTDTVGNFAVEAVPAGTLMGMDGGARGPVKTPVLEFVPGEETVWNPVVAVGAVVHGRAVRRTDRKPVAGVRVRLLHREGTDRSEAAVAWTGTDGHYRFDGVLPGDYAIVAQGRELVWRVRREVCEFAVGDNRAPVQKTLDLVPGARIVGRLLGVRRGDRTPRKVRLRAHHYHRTVYSDAHGRFVFEHVPPVHDAELSLNRRVSSGRFDIVPGRVHEVNLTERTGPPRVVHGVVRDDRGDPVADAIVQLRPYQGASSFPIRLRQTGAWLSATTDSAGRFRIACDWNGRYKRFALQAAHPALTATSVRIELPPPGETLHRDLTLWRGRPIAGRVLDAEGRGLVDVAVSLQATTTDGPKGALALRGETRTDAAGRFRFGPRPPGRYDVAAYPPGATFTRTQIQPGDTDITMRLTRKGVLAGRLLNKASRPSEFPFDVAVWRDGEDEPIAATEMDRAGRFRLENLTPGRYRIGVWGSDDESRIWVETGSTDLILRVHESDR